MINLRDVSYVRMGTKDLEGAEVFATQYLGLEVSERHKDAVYFKSDPARAHALLFRRLAGRPDRGLRDRRAGRSGAGGSELEAMRHEVHLGSVEEADAAQGQGVHRLSAIRPATGSSWSGVPASRATALSWRA